MRKDRHKDVKPARDSQLMCLGKGFRGRKPSPQMHTACCFESISRRSRVLVSLAAVTNYHKLSYLKQHKYYLTALEVRSLKRLH